jgi:hypothetical protein
MMFNANWIIVALPIYLKQQLKDRLVSLFMSPDSHDLAGHRTTLHRGNATGEGALSPRRRFSWRDSGCAAAYFHFLADFGRVVP